MSDQPLTSSHNHQILQAIDRLNTALHNLDQVEGHKLDAIKEAIIAGGPDSGIRAALDELSVEISGHGLNTELQWPAEQFAKRGVIYEASPVDNSINAKLDVVNAKLDAILNNQTMIAERVDALEVAVAEVASHQLAFFAAVGALAPPSPEFEHSIGVIRAATDKLKQAAARDKLEEKPDV